MESMSIWIGSDQRQDAAYAVAYASVKWHLGQVPPVQTRGLVLSALQRKGLYYRPTGRTKGGLLYDTISEHTMSTEFANSRFLVPHLAKRGWALFMDCDMMLRASLAAMFDKLDKRYALYCVKHLNYAPVSSMKMDGQVQSSYQRKNWSSFMVFNCEHPSNKKLTLEMVNTLPGRDLHRFCWLEDYEIGALDPGWNWLVGEQPEPSSLYNVHYTLGGPWLDEFHDAPYADEWRAWRERWMSAA